MFEIPQEWADRTFVLAEKLISYPNQSRWCLQIDADNCSARDASLDVDLPTIREVRNGALSRKSKSTMVVYKGRILVSAGIILFINGRIVLLKRGPRAPVDPLAWTSPAGRCDRLPLLTVALKEFYEELICFDRTESRPVFIRPDFMDTHEEYAVFARIYNETINRRNLEHYSSNSEWLILPARQVDNWLKTTGTIDIRFDATAYTDEMFVFWDEQNNTLETRLVLSAHCEHPEKLGFANGERDQPVQSFSRDQFLGLCKASLVPTMQYFQDCVEKDGIWVEPGW